MTSLSKSSLSTSSSGNINPRQDRQAVWLTGMTLPQAAMPCQISSQVKSIRDSKREIHWIRQCRDAASYAQKAGQKLEFSIEQRLEPHHRDGARSRNRRSRQANPHGRDAGTGKSACRCSGTWGGHGP